MGLKETGAKIYDMHKSVVVDAVDKVKSVNKGALLANGVLLGMQSCFKIVKWGGSAVLSSVTGTELPDPELPLLDIWNEQNKALETTKINSAFKKKIDKQSLYLGRALHDGNKKIYYPTDSIDDLMKPTLLIGSPGSGKTTLAENLAVETAMMRLPKFDKIGFGFFDVADGDAADRLLLAIPEDRKEDIIFLDLSDLERLPAINLLDFGKELMEKFPDTVQGEIIAFFRARFKDGWGWATEEIFTNAISAVMGAGEATILEVLLMITDMKFRNQILLDIKDIPELIGVRRFWQRFNGYSDAQRAQITKPILNKINNILGSQRAKNILCSKSTIDFKEIMDEGKILIVKAPKAVLTEPIINLLMSVIMSKLWLSALSRYSTPKADRRPWRAFLDEPQQYLSNEAGFEHVFTEARKYRYGLVLCFQSPEQKRVKDLMPIMLDASPHLMVFQLSYFGANILGREFISEGKNPLIGLPKYHYLAKLYYQSDDPSMLLIKAPMPCPTFKDDRNCIHETALYYTNDIKEIQLDIINRQLQIDEAKADTLNMSGEYSEKGEGECQTQKGESRTNENNSPPYRGRGSKNNVSIV